MSNYEKFREKEIYREKIVEMVGKIESTDVLMKIYTFVKTHFNILIEKGEV